MKLKLRSVILTAAMIIISVLSCGCTSSEIKGYNATATLSISNLPDSYYSLPKSVRKGTKVSISLRGTQNKDLCPDSVDLTYSNKYKKKVYLEPGEYYISHVYISPEETAPFKEYYEDGKAVKFKVSQDQNTNVELPITEFPEYKPLKEIKKEKPYSHKIQIKDKIYNIEDLTQEFSVNQSSAQEIELTQKKYIAYSLNQVNGLKILVPADNKESEPVGVMIRRNDLKLWGGLTIGEEISEYTGKKGYIGVPNYAKGTPLIGMGIDNTEFVFLNNDSAVSVETGMNGSYVSCITYVFK